MRYEPRTEKLTVYWKVQDCLSWSDAKTACGIGNGVLASFPLIKDKMYLVRFLSWFFNRKFLMAFHVQFKQVNASGALPEGGGDFKRVYDSIKPPVWSRRFVSKFL